MFDYFSCDHPPLCYGPARPHHCLTDTTILKPPQLTHISPELLELLRLHIHTHIQTWVGCFIKYELVEGRFCQTHKKKLTPVHIYMQNWQKYQNANIWCYIFHWLFHGQMPVWTYLRSISRRSLVQDWGRELGVEKDPKTETAHSCHPWRVFHYRPLQNKHYYLKV